MKKILIPTIAALCFSITCFSKATRETKVFGNELVAFSSDGCSQFPDSIVGMDYEECCMEHDYAYWKGGTFEQKEIADSRLASCVGEKAFGALGFSMKTGVGIGGGANLPFTWRWGYGWKMNRGYQALSSEEEQKADLIFSQKPTNLELSNPGIVSYREQITGDNCLDIALKNVLEDLEVSSVEYSISNERTQQNVEGYIRTMNIRIKGCHQPFTAEFLLLRRDACSEKMGELLARGRIRLKRFKSRCSQFEKSRL